MSRTLVAMAIAQALIGVVAVLMWVGAAFSPPAEILGLTGLFVALFLCSAWLFRKAADQEGRTGATNR